MKKAFVLGRDRRYDLLTEMLSDEGYAVDRDAPQTPEKGVFVLPFSASKQEISAFCESVLPGSTVLCYAMPDESRIALEARLVRVEEVSKNRAWRISNGISTAEGVLAAAITETQDRLDGLTALICGYGYCGKAIATLLYLCGTEVWVTSHLNSLRRAEEDGFNVLTDPGAALGMFDLIINTAPAPAIAPEEYARITPGTVLLQVASGQQGIDRPALDRAGVKTVLLPGLPGKVAPLREAEEMRNILLSKDW